MGVIMVHSPFPNRIIFLIREIHTFSITDPSREGQSRRKGRRKELISSYFHKRLGRRQRVKFYFLGWEKLICSAPNKTK